MAVAAAGSVHGGVHLLAWNAPFQTRAETLIWRVSGIAIAAPFALLTTFLVIIWVYDFTNKLLERRFKGWNRPIRKLKERHWLFRRLLKGLSYLGFFSLLGVFIPVYLAARVYLVVECFINLAHLPDAVYKVPEWSNVLPHLGSG